MLTMKRFSKILYKKLYYIGGVEKEKVVEIGTIHSP